MAIFSQHGIDGLAAGRSGTELLVSWYSTLPAGSVYQVYLSRRLAWWGDATSVRLPWPAGQIDIDVGAVSDGVGAVDHSDSLPGITAECCRLDWTDDSFPGELTGFRIHRSAAPGGAPDYTRAIATVAFDPFAGRPSSYTWTSAPIAAGTWTFAVVAIDPAGNLSTPATTTVTVLPPPPPPAADPLGRRLTYTFDPITGRATLNWLPAI